MTTMRALLATRRVVLTCGMGGVGKTTTAAALGLAAARDGRRTLVLTIDPARRLAEVLGIALPAAEPVEVAPRLHALMLDTKRTFDRLIERYAPDPATARTILANPLYRYLAALIVGSQEYMAMEKLYEMLQSEAFECIIVDTPPASQAIDFLRAPQRLIRALTDSMLLLFVRPSMMAGKIGAKALAKGADVLIRIFGRLAGAELLQEMADLLMSTVALFGGFRERAAAVQAMVRDAATTFVLVTTPHDVAVADAIAFVRDLRGEGLHCGGVVVNRALPTVLPALPPALPPAVFPPPLDGAIRANVARYAAALAAERRAIEKLTAVLPPGAALRIYPLQAEPPTEITTLEEMARCLTDTTSA